MYIFYTVKQNQDLIEPYRGFCETLFPLNILNIDERNEIFLQL